MNKKIQEILKDVVDEEKLNNLLVNYEDIKNQSIVSTGLDSLEYITFLSQLEELEIDLETIDNIQTFQDLENILSAE